MTNPPRPSESAVLRWRKSTRSGSNANCVGVASLRTAVAVRDSKDPSGPRLVVGRRDWIAFLDAVKRRELNRSW
ncbi:DUF397 domain-containing protein [Actinomadura sp. HBU206391]|nr:DUF397 domain-containing protein [Actinomadura sp. HBU206391]